MYAFKQDQIVRGRLHTTEGLLLQDSHSDTFIGEVIQSDSRGVYSKGYVSSSWAVIAFEIHETTTSLKSISSAPSPEVDFSIQDIIKSFYDKYPSIQDISFNRFGTMYVRHHISFQHAGETFIEVATKGFEKVELMVKYFDNLKEE